MKSWISTEKKESYYGMVYMDILEFSEILNPICLTITMMTLENGELFLLIREEDTVRILTTGKDGLLSLVVTN